VAGDAARSAVCNAAVDVPMYEARARVRKRGRGQRSVVGAIASSLDDED
jgi:hypothetical protein